MKLVLHALSLIVEVVLVLLLAVTVILNFTPNSNQMRKDKLVFHALSLIAIDVVVMVFAAIAVGDFTPSNKEKYVRHALSLIVANARVLMSVRFVK